MINKIVASATEALADIRDGATVMIGGFGTAGQPNELIDALIATGAKDLVIVNNNAGNGDVGLAALIEQGMVAKLICSFPRSADPRAFTEKYLAGEIAPAAIAKLHAMVTERLRDEAAFARWFGRYNINHQWY